MREQYEAWQRSSHGRVAVCNDCHAPHHFPDKWVVKGINGLKHSVAFTFGNFHEPIRITPFNARVVQANCEDCHRSLIAHMTGPHTTEPLMCISCHGSVGHRTRD
jgi:cytochrome c nitrite reductase small subunit